MADVNSPFEKNDFSTTIPSNVPVIAPSALFVPSERLYIRFFLRCNLEYTTVSLLKIKSACQDKRDLLSRMM